MKDPRLRLASMVVLSVASFVAVVPAIASVIWVLVFSERKFSVPSWSAFLGLIAMITTVSVISYASVSGGISYFIRMCSLIFIAIWAYSEIRPGEMLDTLVWLLGNNKGFELGVVAETSMTELRRIPSDFRTIKTAISFKSRKFDLRDYIPVLGNMLIMSLRRAEDQGKILARRGYISGGTHSPEFVTPKKDIAGFILGLAVLLLVFKPLVTYL